MPRSDADSLRVIEEELARQVGGKKRPTSPEQSPHAESSLPRWPTMVPAAYYGAAGEMVRIIEPHTEADPVAILMQTLVAFGGLIGRTAFHQHEATQHFTNEYLVVVGDTADGRKGTSWGQVRRPLVAVDADWAGTRITPGLSSAEGLLHAIRDKNEDREDEGVSDKRLLVMEPEFATVLRQFERSGNTLSAMLRAAWEGMPLVTLTKGSPARCEAPHLSIIGHITADELRRLLSATDAANGLANRHMFVLAKRSRMLPHGGNLDFTDLEPVIKQMRIAADFARGVGEVRRTSAARDLWAAEYARLSSGRPGVVGNITARALGHVTRLSLIYAVLDECDEVHPDHLRAALACWDYACASVLYVFGDSTGDRTADEIRDLLRAAGGLGVTKTEMRDHFGRNKAGTDIDRALALLHRIGDADRMNPEITGGKGRPAERWMFTGGR